MSNNQNTEYEKFVQDLYQTLSDSDQLSADVQHDVKIEGKSGCKHQIDVYWEYELMGEMYRTAVECKNYNTSVSIGKLRDFFGVLHDIGNIKGVFVAKNGYQKGAKEFADFYGISVKEAREPNEADWKNRVKDIHYTINVANISVKETNIGWDWQWISENMPDFDVQSYFRADQIKIVDSEGVTLTTIHDLHNGLPQNWTDESDMKETYYYKEEYLKLPNRDPIKINSISFIYDVSIYVESFESEGESIAKAILKDALSGDTKFFDNSGDVKNV